MAAGFSRDGLLHRSVLRNSLRVSSRFVVWVVNKTLTKASCRVNLFLHNIVRERWNFRRTCTLHRLNSTWLPRSLLPFIIRMESEVILRQVRQKYCQGTIKLELSHRPQKAMKKSARSRVLHRICDLELTLIRWLLNRSQCVGISLSIVFVIEFDALFGEWGRSR